MVYTNYLLLYWWHFFDYKSSFYGLEYISISNYRLMVYDDFRPTKSTHMWVADTEALRILEISKKCVFSIYMLISVHISIYTLPGRK